MRSLAVKMLFVVILVSLISIVLVAIFTRYAMVTAYDRLLRERQKEAFIELAREYFETYGTWAGFYNGLHGPNGLPANVSGLILIDQYGRVMVPNMHYPQNTVLSERQLSRGTAVLLNGARIGTVLEDAPPPVRNPLDELYLQRTTSALILAAVSAMAFALVLGALWARSLTRPLRELTVATQAMAQGRLEQVVPVRSEDELGELAASFNRMSADLTHANALRRQMTADIAHDLRTPLTVIKGYTEALRDGDLPPTPTTFETMYQEAEHLNRLIDDLRTLSLADAGELTLNPCPESLQELLEQARLAYLPLATAAGIVLETAVEPTLPEIPLDAERMARVLGNLIGNALRHTPAGGQVTLGARAIPGGAELFVRDTGAGIEPQDLPHIFERFYRGDAARQADTGESGLGLAIARSLVEAHGGTLAVESAPGQGATFTITLPAPE